MAGYVELIEGGRTWEQTERGVTARRIFLEKPGGGASLPDIGDRYSSSGLLRAAILRRLQHVGYWWDRAVSPAVRREKIECDYNSNEPGAQIHRPVDTDERALSAGAEIIQIAEPDGTWAWEESAQDIEDSPVFIRQPTGTISRQRVCNSDGAKKTFWAKALLCLGRINSKEFEDCRIGSVLFAGISGGTQKDAQGKRIWVFSLHFQWRLVTAFGGLTYLGNKVEEDDWLYAWSNQTAGGAGTYGGAWDKPFVKGTTPHQFAYDKANFDTLF